MCIEEARRLRSAALEALLSATRLARTWAYSFCYGILARASAIGSASETYGLVLDLLGLAALERSAVALVLQTLGSDQTLDLGRLGVGLGALLLRLNLATDDVLADLFPSY